MIVLLEACCITIITTLYGVLACSDNFMADTSPSSKSVFMSVLVHKKGHSSVYRKTVPEHGKM